MKITKLLLLLLMTLPFTVFSQSSEKGNIVGEAGVGLGIYNTHATDKKTGTTSENRAGAIVYPLGAEYGITDRFGVGAYFRFNKYLQDSANKNVDVHSFDLVIRPAYHFVNRNKLNMSVHLNLGGSYLRWNPNNASGATASGLGGIFGGGLNTQLYFGKRFGIFFDYTYYSFTYGNFKTDDGHGNLYYYKFAFDGSNYVLGFQFKIK